MSLYLQLFGFLLHYVALAALGWMCVEALYMYLALVRVFQTYYAKFHLKCAALGWGKASPNRPISKKLGLKTILLISFRST